MEWYTLAIPVDSADDSEGPGSIYFTFIVFPAGEYEIGSPEDEPDREDNELRRRVRLTRGFELSDRPLTWRQFDAFDGGSHREAFVSQTGRELGDDDPVFGVNWFESVAYCRWLTMQSGLLDRDQAYAEEPLESNKDKRPGWVELPDATDWSVRLATSGYRLPTEAEWEVACRSGTLTAYSFGGDAGLLSHYGWYQDNSDRWSRAVGLVRPNLRGLLDMHGNVYDWCHDWYADEAGGQSVDPVGPEKGLYRVTRGGGWAPPAMHCRSASQNGYLPSIRYDYVGFRPARSLIEE
jgi:formylglycine-generating enzyme required for sulfatase activity